MIIQNHPTGGTSVLLYDMHGEYSGGLSDLRGYVNGEFVRCETAWDFSAIIDAASAAQPDKSWDDVDADVADAFQKLFPGMEDRFGVSLGTGSLWTIYGSSPKALERVFAHMVETLDEPPSGDDAVFDYWPSAMRMLHEFAVDLDSMIGGDHLGRYRALLPNAGRYMEEFLEEGKLEA